MGEKQPKKKTMLNILDILNKYTDAEHTLSQKEIQEKLENEYSVKIERKAIKRNLMNLIECCFNIEYSEVSRKGLNKKTGQLEDTSMLTDFYIERDFSDAELRLLIDSIVFSNHIPQGDKKRLIEKLEGLSNVYFKSRMKHIATVHSGSSPVNTLFYTIDILDEAISKGRQVRFHYDEYGMDKKLHHRKNSEGKVREYIINPYQIVATGGRYYLVCNYDKYDKLSNYRLDRISDIELLETDAKPINKVSGMQHGLDLKKHIEQHIYMFSDKIVRAKFIAKKGVLNDIIDFFGRDVQFYGETEDTITVTVNISEQDMLLWAMQFATEVTVTEPAHLAEKCRENILKAAEKYKALKIEQ
ncbi:MAG: WYL domain-containing protein [Clostridia bacterium]|nr:WYL domain-containing protein [Clostridia bacterium]